MKSSALRCISSSSLISALDKSFFVETLLTPNTLLSWSSESHGFSSFQECFLLFEAFQAVLILKSLAVVSLYFAVFMVVFFAFMIVFLFVIVDTETQEICYESMQRFSLTSKTLIISNKTYVKQMRNRENSCRKTKGKKELFFGGCCGEGMSYFIDSYESHARTTLSQEKQENEKVQVSISYRP